MAFIFVHFKREEYLNQNLNSMLKPAFVALICFFLIDAALAQKRDTTVYYLKADGRPTSIVDSADVIITFLSPDTSINKDLFIVQAYYPNGKIKYIANSETNKLKPIDSAIPYYFKPNLQGQYIAYFQNGHKKQIATFENGEQVGDEISYYPNGKFFCMKRCMKNNYLLKSCADSTGAVLSGDGKGKWIDFSDDSFMHYMAGDIKDGFREGKWLGVNSDLVKVFCNYVDNRITSSGYYDESGAEIYNHAEVAPEFPGGQPQLFAYLGGIILKAEQAQGYHVRGRVIVNFIVDELGKLNHIAVKGKFGSEISDELATRIQRSPKWKPGAMNGKPVKVNFTVDFTFNGTMIN
ncbi:energy transducer TonB [Mucilaginibacter gotjawali]|uniref:Gram-negative bacterial tonB protein n=2 Tax=Mucilaginibacter gotjawali TaxID=1550579 RepID=A0A0X8X1Y3_9SPHI|nr:energy transducer TonB [Mucilaginibacter gotjawali]MBB3053876.1 hypothetical protein [Mucilaginibacter gotjawali]BAU54140.1 Gram-negative bacterial tonB protein [Mucilaginibacter gotjawali]